MTEDIALPEAPHGLSQSQRVVNTFVAPSTTFTDILRNTSWWLPFVLMVLSTLAVSYTIDHKVGWPQVVETQVHLNPAQESQMSSLSAEDRALQMQRMTTGYRYVSYAYPIIILAFAALGSLILWASFNFGLGASTTFGQILCLWMFANLPRIFSALITIVQLCFGGSPESFDLKQPAGTNIGYYLSDASPWLRTLLGSFDVIGIWVVVLLTIGGAIIAKVSIGRAAAVVVGWWLLVVLVSTVAAAAFS